MTKSYLFLALVFTIVLAKNCSADILPGAGADHGDDSGEKDPSVNCVLFGDNGCDIGCTVKGQVYGFEAYGHCTENQSCTCFASRNTSFYLRWKKLFDAEYVYSKIIEDQNKEYIAEAIFSNPFRTAEEFKQLLKPIVSPYQFSKLKVCDERMAAKFTNKGEGKVDEEALKKYVSESVGKLLKSNANKSLLNTKYQQRFTNFLTESGGEEGTLYNIAFRISQSKNKALEQLLKEYLKKNGLEEPQVDAIDNEDLPTTILNTVDNEIIKLINEKNEAPSANKKTAPGKKPAKRPTKRPVKRAPAKSEPAAKDD